jgi:DinB superfamily
MSHNLLTLAVQNKFHETVEQTQHLISLVPKERLHWRPGKTDGNYSEIGHVLGHLLSCMEGFCAVMHRAFPAELKHFADLRSMEIDHFCEPEEALERIRFLAACVDEGFLQCSDSDLERMLSTVFVPGGESMLALFLNNLEHLINHKYQLFFYLKLLGVNVGSADLYRFRS